MRKSDWDAADDDFMRQERERLGGPPKPEEVAALLRGDLSDADAARVRALLVYYPELTSILIEKEPPAVEPLLSAEEKARDWEATRSRLEPPTRNLLRKTLPLAAMLALGFIGGLLVRRREPEAPRVHIARHALDPMQVLRGSGEQRPYPLRSTETNLIVLRTEGGFPDREYRIDIVAVEEAPRRTVWRSDPVRPLRDGTFAISIPRAFLRPSVYQIEIYGLDRTPRHLASYPIDVEP